MRKYLFMLFLSLTILLSGCSGLNLGGGSSDNVPEEDITGSGLKINLELKDDWISQKRVDYYLTIENSGSDEIVLSRENFRLYTLQVDDDGVTDAFTDESVEEFYSNLFQNGDLILPQNAEITGISGQLMVENWLFSDLNAGSFDYVLEVLYDYKTHFKNNLEITKGEKKPLRITDKLSQAAPVKISEIKAEPFEDYIYYVSYKISNKGELNANDEYLIELNDFNIEFGSRRLTDCIGYIEENGNKKKLERNEYILNKDRPQFYYACKVSFENYDNLVTTTTTTSGEFSYNYANFEKGSISLPKERDENFWN